MVSGCDCPVWRPLLGSGTCFWVYAGIDLILSAEDGEHDGRMVGDGKAGVRFLIWDTKRLTETIFE